LQQLQWKEQAKEEDGIKEREIKLQKASHKSKSSSILWGIVDSYSTLPRVMWEAVTVVEGIP